MAAINFTILLVGIAEVHCRLFLPYLKVVMGNICDCLKGASAEPAYSPIETVEVVTVSKPRPVERSTNNYQTILEKASGNFISSQYRSRSEGVGIQNSSEGAETVRSRFSNAQINPQVVCSPPSTGIVLQSYATFSAPDLDAAGPVGAKNSPTKSGSSTDANSSSNTRTVVSAVSALHVKPSQDSTLEISADGLALLVMKQTDRNIDRFSSNPNEVSAVVGFKPFEGTIASR